MDTYAMAYTEVLEILKYLPEEELSKIPKEKIEFLESNKDKDYKFSIKYTDDIAKNNISRKAYAIMTVFYNDYFLSEEEQIELQKVLKENSLKEEKRKKEMYKTEDMFKKNNIDISDQSIQIDENFMEVAKKQNIITKIITKLKMILHIK